MLTTDGWKAIADVKMSDRVATLDASGRLSYERPEAVLSFPEVAPSSAGRKMVRVRGKHIDLEVTADHRMFVCNGARGAIREFSLRPADSIVLEDVRYKRDALWVAEEDTAEEEYRSDDWLVCFGTSVALLDSDDPRSVDGDNCSPFFYFNRGAVVEARDRSIARCVGNKPVLLRVLEADVELLRTYRRMPGWTWRLNQRRAAVLLDSLLLGDRGQGFSTKSERMADDLQRLALHAGASATKSQILRDSWRVEIDRSRDACEPMVDDVEYDYTFAGPVYCLTVPGPGVFYTRRDGKPCWTGNSRGANGPVVLLTRQPAEGRARDGGLRVGEMELECLWAHGTMYFLKERFMECSDNYRIFVCTKCGMMATVNPERGIYFCKACKNITEFAEFRVPYASKLLLQEIETMSIGARFDAAGLQQVVRPNRRRLGGGGGLLALPAPP